MQDVMTSELVKVPHDAPCRFCMDRMKEKGIRHLLVYQKHVFIGVISLRRLAALMTEGRGKKDSMVNFVGGMVLLFMLGIIGLLVYLVPEMLDIVQRFFP